jgi:hypothetical protein
LVLKLPSLSVIIYPAYFSVNGKICVDLKEFVLKKTATFKKMLTRIRGRGAQATVPYMVLDTKMVSDSKISLFPRAGALF